VVCAPVNTALAYLKHTPPRVLPLGARPGRRGTDWPSASAFVLLTPASGARR